MKTLKFVLVLFVYLHFECSKSEEIKYELSVTTPEYNYNKTNHSQEVVTSAEKAFSITVLNDVPVLRKGMLDISPDTYYFWMDYNNLERIEPGAFDNQNITVEIRLEGNKLSLISRGTFKNLRIEKLGFNYNQITHLEEGAISDLPNLWELDLMGNKIAKFDGTAVINTPKMWSFLLARNNLTKLGEKNFNFMKKDEDKGVIVGVGFNQIEDIHPKTFQGINVFNLGLENNKLKRIPEEVFTGNNIIYLNLKHNQLEDLPEAFFDQKKLGDLNVESNPLKCDFQKKLKKFVEEAKVFRFFYDKDNC